MENQNVEIDLLAAFSPFIESIKKVTGQYILFSLITEQKPTDKDLSLLKLWFKQVKICPVIDPLVAPYDELNSPDVHPIRSNTGLDMIAYWQDGTMWDCSSESTDKRIRVFAKFPPVPIAKSIPQQD